MYHSPLGLDWHWHWPSISDTTSYNSLTSSEAHTFPTPPLSITPWHCYSCTYSCFTLVNDYSAYSQSLLTTSTSRIWINHTYLDATLLVFHAFFVREHQSEAPTVSLPFPVLPRFSPKTAALPSPWSRDWNPFALRPRTCQHVELLRHSKQHCRMS